MLFQSREGEERQNWEEKEKVLGVQKKAWMILGLGS